MKTPHTQEQLAVAANAVDALFLDISLSYGTLTPIVPAIHKGRAYQRVAVEHARAVEKLESRFTHRIFATAATITTISPRHWEKDADIVKLWGKVAQAVTFFSEHPTKKVATLVVNQVGALQTFGVNRVPEGVSRHGLQYSDKVRKHYIVCSERNALARVLGLSVHPLAPRQGLLPLNDRAKKSSNQLRAQIGQLTREIIEIGPQHTELRDSYLITTASPCGTCAHAIAPLRPKGILTYAGGGKNFSRIASIHSAVDYLAHAGIPISYIPA